jgi:DMSO/TMAO reductase YedYZ molybdopterin-dependent catalytic subunit
MNTRFSCIHAALILMVAGVIDTPSDEAPPRIAVRGAVPSPIELSIGDLERMPKRTARVKDRDGKVVEYEGVALAEALKAAGIELGETLRGRALANFVVVEGSDGYRVVFALAELDAGTTDRLTLLAFRKDGRPLGRDEGPLRVIVPDEKRAARWVRGVIAFVVVRG